MMLSVASFCLLLLVALPIRELAKKRNPRKLFSKYWVQGIFYLYLLLVILMSVFSFTGLIQILLPVKIVLLSVYAFLRYKLKGSLFGNKKGASSEAP